ncbi:hypothetical protein ACFOY2_29665 [Nonomuraea purpurea]|uniref:Uncharacterized protein n=1 Tax=Nonomuraea purpurea TaxID=1849276 RepID=A0ABV8GEJ5_9ACTN
MALLSSIRARVRQLRHPREFRIHAAAWPEDALAAFERLVANKPAEIPDDGLRGPSVAEVVTSIWRLDRRVRRLPGESRVMTRYLEMAWDTFTKAGITVQEHMNDPFDPGLAIEVLSYQGQHDRGVPAVFGPPRARPRPGEHGIGP